MYVQRHWRYLKERFWLLSVWVNVHTMTLALLERKALTVSMSERTCRQNYCTYGRPLNDRNRTAMTTSSRSYDNEQLELWQRAAGAMTTSSRSYDNEQQEHGSSWHTPHRWRQQTLLSELVESQTSSTLLSAVIILHFPMYGSRGGFTAMPQLVRFPLTLGRGVSPT